MVDARTYVYARLNQRTATAYVQSIANIRTRKSVYRRGDRALKDRLRSGGLYEVVLACTQKEKYCVLTFS